jgi:hypothetical protein
VTDGEMDEVLKRRSKAGPEVDGELVERIVESIQRTIGPVRPLPATWALKSCLAAACVAFAALGAAKLGLSGVHALTAWDGAVIFTALAAFIWLAAGTVVSEMIPGSARTVKPGTLLVGGCLVIIWIFWGLFDRYSAADFVHAGMVCLGAGLLQAIPMGVFAWLVLRRGFVLHPVAAGLAAGTLGGLAGITMLELHCPNLESSHAIVWHTAVIFVSAGCGAFVASTPRLLRRSGGDK